MGEVRLEPVVVGGGVLVLRLLMADDEVGGVRGLWFEDKLLKLHY